MSLIVILIVAGLVLLFLETILPGLVAGTIGALCLIAGVVLGFTTFGFVTGSWILLAVGLLLTVGVLLWVKYFPTSRAAQVFISKSAIADPTPLNAHLQGKEGTALTELRPCGTALIQDQRVDVISEGSSISKGTPVRVVAVEGFRVVVRAVSH